MGKSYKKRDCKEKKRRCKEHCEKEYTRKPVVVTEYDEIDLSHNHHYEASPGKYQMSAANRYLHNPVTNMVTNIFATIAQQAGPTKDTMLYIPSYAVNIPQIKECGYINLPFPQYYSSAWLRGANYNVGLVDARGLPVDRGYGGDFNYATFEEKLYDPDFQQMNHHNVFGAISTPDYFLATPAEREARYQEIAEAVCAMTDMDMEAELVPVSVPVPVPVKKEVTAKHDGEDHDHPVPPTNCVLETISNIKALWPAELPPFPRGSIPDQRKVTNGSGAMDGYPDQICPFSNSRAIFAGSGREFTNVEYPYGYAFQMGGGDFVPVGWHWSNVAGLKAEDFPGKKVMIRNEFFIDFDFAQLYSALLTILIALGLPKEQASGLLQLKFAEFGFDPTQTAEVAYKDLHATWAGTANPLSEEFILPMGKSKSFGRSTVLPVLSKIVMVQPHFHDHTMKTELYVEDGFKSELVHTFVPDLKENLAAHDGTPQFLDYGPINSPIGLHSHPYPSHLPPRGLQDALWFPKDLVVEDPVRTVFRTVGYFKNPHPQTIDNMAISIIVWTALDGNASIPQSQPAMNSCDMDHM